MKKKQAKRLVLAKETITALLPQVGGAAGTVCFSSVCSNLQCTTVCTFECPPITG